MDTEIVDANCSNSVLKWLCGANWVIIPSIFPGAEYTLFVSIVFVGFAIATLRCKVIFTNEKISVSYLFSKREVRCDQISKVTLAPLENSEYSNLLHPIIHDSNGTEADLEVFDFRFVFQQWLRDNTEISFKTIRKHRNSKRFGLIFVLILVFLSSALNISYSNENWRSYIQANVKVTPLKADVEPGF